MTKEERRAKKQAEYEALSETQRLIYDQKKEIRTVLLFFSLFLPLLISFLFPLDKTSHTIFPFPLQKSLLGLILLLA